MNEDSMLKNDIIKNEKNKGVEKMHKMFNQLVPDNIQNARYVILGESGSGKTKLMNILIGYEMRKHRRIFFLEGGKSIILDELEDIYVNKCFIELIRINLTSENIIEKLKEIEQLINKETLENTLLYTLFCIDDISHLIKDSGRLQSFLSKVYTTSRQAHYDCICILHSLKMGNVVMRNNCNKLFITSPDKQYIEEFKEVIVDKEIWPIVIDFDHQPIEQIKLDFEKMGKMTLQEFIARVGLTNPNSYPKIIRSEKRRNARYITIRDSEFEKFQTKIPKNFFNNLRTGKKKLELKNKLLQEREKITIGENNAVNTIQSNLNTIQQNPNTIKNNINWDKLYNISNYL